jgi:hypothetical protein
MHTKQEELRNTTQLDSNSDSDDIKATVTERPGFIVRAMQYYNKYPRELQ